MAGPRAYSHHIRNWLTPVRYVVGKGGAVNWNEGHPDL